MKMMMKIIIVTISWFNHNNIFMKHLVFTVTKGFVEFRMGERMGSHPLGDDPADWVINYLLKLIKPETYEII